MDAMDGPCEGCSKSASTSSFYVSQHDSKLKQIAKEWKESGTSAPKRFRAQKSAKGVIASVFRDAKRNFCLWTTSTF